MLATVHTRSAARRHATGRFPAVNWLTASQCDAARPAPSHLSNRSVLTTHARINKMNEELLIELVRQYPELFNPFDKKYHDELRRNNIWCEIGNMMKENRKFLMFYVARHVGCRCCCTIWQVAFVFHPIAKRGFGFCMYVLWPNYTALWILMRDIYFLLYSK